MKIIQFIAENTLTGGPRHVFDLANGLKKRGHQVVVIKLRSLGRRAQIKELRQKLIEIKKGCHSDRGRHRDRAEESLSKVRGPSAIARDDAAGVVFHCHGVRGGLIGRLAARGLKIPVVYTEHLWTSDFHLKNPLREKLQLAILRKLDKYTTRTIAVSNAVRDFLLAQKIAPAGKISVVYNGISVPNLSSPITHHASPIIGSMGADNYIKDFATLRKAFAIVKKEFPKAELKIEHNEKDLDKFYRSISVYVQPSLSESFGIAVAEAMSYAVPVVATRVGGLKELIEDGKTGILVEAHSADNLAEAIIKLLKNENLRRAISEAGRQNIIQNFSLEKMINETEKEYVSIS